MSFSSLVFEKNAGLATLTLNRPSALNAVNVALRDDLFQALSAISADDEIGVVILRGAGRAFCAGADTTEFGTAPSPVEARRIRHIRPIWQMLGALPQPVIVAMHGFAIGAGLEMAMLADIRIASEGTFFAVPEVSLGLIPGAGGSQTFPRVVHTGDALRWVLSGQRMTTAEALRIGLISQIIPAETLQDTATDMARAMLRSPWPLLRATKRAVNQGIELPLADGLALEHHLAQVAT